MNLATLHRTAPKQFLPQEHHTTKTDLIQDIDIPTPERTDHTPPTMVTDMEDISISHNLTTIPTCNRSSSFRRHTLCSSSSHYSSLAADGCPHYHLCHDTSNQHMYTPSHTHHFSHRHHSHHYSIARSWSCSSNSHHTAQETQPRKPSQPKTFNPIDPTIPRLSSSRTPHQILPQIQTVTLIL